MAQLYAQRHDRERAFLWLQGLVNYLKCDPLLSELHADPRYALLAQPNLPH